jgi:cation:H+ antiporter
MTIDVLQILLGGVLLYLGAEWLVRGAAGLARSLGVTPLVVGLTVVAFGTSAPELVVSIIASLGGRGPLVIGNVVGSNIANLGLILGLMATLSRLAVDGGLVRREVPALLLSTLLLPLLLVGGEVSRLEGGVLVLVAVALTVLLVRAPSRDEVERERDQVEQVAPSDAATPSRLVLAGMVVVGLVVLVFGGRFLIGSAARLALALGMSERLVGLTIVAVGTSLPELAASVIASVRGHGAMAVGNILGSNVFNVLLVLGGGALVRPVEARLWDFTFDLASLGPFTLFTAYVLRGRRTTCRWEGLLLLVGYLVYLLLLADRSS